MDAIVEVGSSSELDDGVDRCAELLRADAVRTCRDGGGLEHEELEVYVSSDLVGSCSRSSTEMEVLPRRTARVVLSARARSLRAYSFFGNVVVSS